MLETSTPACLVCQGASQYWFTKNDHRIFKCTDCKLVFVAPMPDATAVYDQEYFCGASHGFGYSNYDADKQVDDSFDRYLDHIEQLSSTRGHLLDVGAATGQFVRRAVDRGWQARGVEVSDYAASVGRERGLEITTGTVQEQRYPDAHFNVVTLWDVLEHIGQPDHVLDELQRIVTPRGLIALNVPDAGSPYARLAGRHWQLILPPEHLILYNRRNLTSLLSRHGFVVAKTTRIPKRFRPSYVLQVLSTVRNSSSIRRMSEKIRGSALDKIALPVNMRDNLFVIACKR